MNHCPILPKGSYSWLDLKSMLKHTLSSRGVSIQHPQKGPAAEHPGWFSVNTCGCHRYTCDGKYHSLGWFQWPRSLAQKLVPRPVHRRYPLLTVPACRPISQPEMTCMCAYISYYQWCLIQLSSYPNCIYYLRFYTCDGTGIWLCCETTIGDTTVFPHMGAHTIHPLEC